MREAINHERGAAGEHLRQRIAEMEQERASASEGRDQVQEQFRQNVQTTNERVSELTGELAAFRQKRPLGVKLTKRSVVPYN